MRYVKEFAAVLALLMLAGCAGKPVQESPVATDEGIPAGQIYLYGEIHGIAAIEEYEAERWKECYERGMRHLFVELSHYTAQWLNLWMDAEDDEILEQLHQDWESTLSSGAETLDFYRTIKEQCPETVFHGTDVGHQYDSTGARYQDYLEERGLADTEDYRLTLEGESVMGIYGAAHTDPDAMADSAGTVPSMAAQLVERYGDSLHTEDISWIAWEPQRTDTLTVAGKEYQASYFGEEDISGWAGDYQSRAFWRLEGAYEDFEDCPESSDVLPCNDYPMPIEAGQVFVLGYTRKDGTSERKYYRSDGEVWNGMDCTTEFIPE